MRYPALEKPPDLAFHVVFHAPNCRNGIVDQQIGCPRIAIVRQPHTTGIGDRFADKRPVRMSVNRKRTIEFGELRVIDGNPPQIARGCMNQRELLFEMLPRQGGQPREPRLAQLFASPLRHRIHLGHHGSGAEQHLVGIPANPRPLEIANAVHDFAGAGTGIRQIPAMQNQIRGCVAKVRQHGLECRQIPVDIGNNRDAHITA